MIAAPLYLIPSVLMFRYAIRITPFLERGHSDDLDAALDAQRLYWKVCGILVIVCLCVALLACGVGFLAGLAATAA